MRLTDLEYQGLKTRFHCTAWPDEDSRVPLEVEGRDDGPPWAIYVSGDKLPAVHRWIRQLRRPPDLRAVSGIPAPEADPVPAPARKAA